MKRSPVLLNHDGGAGLDVDSPGPVHVGVTHALVKDVLGDGLLLQPGGPEARARRKKKEEVSGHYSRVRADRACTIMLLETHRVGKQKKRA